jgi:hypothetical protein
MRNVKKKNCGVFYAVTLDLIIHYYEDEENKFIEKTPKFLESLKIDEYIQAIQIGLYCSDKKTNKEKKNDILSLRLDL